VWKSEVKKGKARQVDVGKSWYLGKCRGRVQVSDGVRMYLLMWVLHMQRGRRRWAAGAGAMRCDAMRCSESVDR
jgi:hypothetical protein